MTVTRRGLATCAVAWSLLAFAGPSGCGSDGGGAPAIDEPQAPAGGGGDGGDPAPGAPPTDPATLRIWFKLDPRLTAGVYMGDRWVSPATFQVVVQSGATCEIAARARSAERRPGDPATTWTSSDPTSVSIDPAQGEQVVISVLRPGRSSVVVSDGVSSVTVTVDAAPQNGAWTVTLSQ